MSDLTDVRGECIGLPIAPNRSASAVPPRQVMATLAMCQPSAVAMHHDVAGNTGRPGGTPPGPSRARRVLAGLLALPAFLGIPAYAMFFLVTVYQPTIGDTGIWNSRFAQISTG